MDRAHRQRIDIQTPITETVEGYGNKRITGYTTTYAGVAATWIHTGGSETFRGRQIQADIVGVFEIRYHPRYQITPDMSVLWNGVRYEIYSARPCESKTEGGFKKIEIFVKAIA